MAIKSEERFQLIAQLQQLFTFRSIKGSLYYRDPVSHIYRPAQGSQWVYGEILKMTAENQKAYSSAEMDTLLDNALSLLVHDEGEEADEMDYNLIPFSNGVHDVRQPGSLLPYTKEMVFTSRIPHAYNPSAPACKDVDAFLHDITCGRKDVEDVIWKALGYTLLRATPYRRGILLKSKARSGKSRLLNMVNAAIGEENSAHVDIADFDKEGERADLVGKLADIADDIKTDFIPDTSILKKVISGDMIKARTLYKNAFAFRPYSTIWAATNGMPRVKDEGGAVSDRFIIIPLDASFEEGAPGTKSTTEMDTLLSSDEAVAYVLRRAVEALEELLKAGGFPVLDISKKAAEEWKASNRPVALFLDEYKDEKEIVSLDGIYADELYRDYGEWCDAQGVQGKLSFTIFRSRVEEEEGNVTSGTKTKRVKSRITQGGKTYRFTLIEKPLPSPDSGKVYMTGDFKRAPSPALSSAPAPAPVIAPEDDMDLFHDDEENVEF